MRVAVVGAGPAGLFSLRALQKSFGDYNDTNAEAEPTTVQYVCYERRPTVGGEWVFTDENATSPDFEPKDTAGKPMLTSMYKELSMNTPTLLMQPHPEHAFPDGTALYPSQQDMCNYLLSFAAKFQLEKYVRFGKVVSDISYIKASDSGTATGHFAFKVTDLATRKVDHEQCDYVMMCIGQYRTPKIPDDVSYNEFSGETLHYHWLRDPARMNGKRILVVGSSWAAIDMVIILNRPGRAAKMHISWHSAPPFWSKSVAHQVSLHPKISKAAGKTVTFVDGSTVEVDVILFCTGFSQEYPLHGDLQLDFSENPYLFPLYKHLVHPKYPQLLFLGKASVFAMYIMRPQAEFACAVMQGRVKLPTESEMLGDISKFQTYWNAQLARTGEFNMKQYFPLGELEYALAQSLIETAGLEPMAPAGFFTRGLYQGIIGVIEDVMHFKSYILEYRENPEKPGEKLFYIVPPKK